MAKADLQERARSLGVSFTDKTTVAELEELIADAESGPSGPGVSYTSEDEICVVCRGVADHVHRR